MLYVASIYNKIVITVLLYGRWSEEDAASKQEEITLLITLLSVRPFQKGKDV